MTEVTRKDNIMSRGLQGCHRSEMSVLVHLWATSLQANSLLYGTTDIPAQECTSVYICGLRVCKQTRFCMEPRTSPPKNVHPVHSWATSLQANSLLYGTTDVLVAVEQCTSMYTVQRRVCGANSLLLNFTDIPVRSEKPFTISFFANSLSGSVHPCTLPDASFCCAKTSLLIRTPDIRVRSETTRREQK